MWVHEIKHDGYRLIVRRSGDRVRLFTRRGYDWSDRYPRIVEAAKRLKGSFVIDGETVVSDKHGIADFEKVHSRDVAIADREGGYVEMPCVHCCPATCRGWKSDMLLTHGPI